MVLVVVRWFVVLNGEAAYNAYDKSFHFVAPFLVLQNGEDEVSENFACFDAVDAVVLQPVSVPLLIVAVDDFGGFLVVYVDFTSEVVRDRNGLVVGYHTNCAFKFHSFQFLSLDFSDVHIVEHVAVAPSVLEAVVVGVVLGEAFKVTEHIVD